MKTKTARRLSVISVLMIAIMMFAACSGAPASSLATASSGGVVFEKTTIRFGTTSAENTMVVATMQDFAQRVSDATGGAVTVELFPASQLGNVREMAQQAQMGVLDMCLTQPANLAEMGIGTMSVLVLPYIFTDYEQRWNVLTSEIGQELLDDVTNGGIQLRGFGYFMDGARNFFTVEGKPIRQLEDVKGLKLRVQDFDIDNDMAIALGASPTPTATSEMYSALQSGIVDGAEQPIAGYYGNKYYEVSSYFTLDEHTYNTPVVLFSELSWANLSPELQDVLTAAWEGARDDSKQKILDNEIDLLAKIEAEGVEVIRLTDRDKWVEAMAPVYEEHASDKMDLVERIRAVK